MRGILIATLSGVLLAACAGVPPQRLSYTTAQSMTPESLRRAAVEQFGLVFRDVGEPGSGGFDRGFLSTLQLATAPEDAGMPGLCEATVLTLYFRPEDRRTWQVERDLQNNSATVRAGYLHTVYGASGDTSPADSDEALQAARCDELAAWTFFHAQDAVDAWYAVRLVDQIRRRSQEGSLELDRFDCSGPVGCDDRQAMLTALSLSNLVSAEARSCTAFDVVNLRPLVRSVPAGCMLVSVLVAEENNERTIMELGIRFDPGNTRADILPDPQIIEAAASVSTIAFD